MPLGATTSHAGHGAARPRAPHELIPATGILVVLLVGAVLVVYLADPTLLADASDWMATARRLALTGGTGLRHRNI